MDGAKYSDSRGRQLVPCFRLARQQGETEGIARALLPRFERSELGGKHSAHDRYIERQDQFGHATQHPSIRGQSKLEVWSVWPPV